MFLARKVDLARWQQREPGFAEDEVPADLLHSDLKTKRNDLSFWEFDASADPEWTKEAALAIVAGWQRVDDSLYLAWVDEDLVRVDSVQVVPSKGRTRVDDLQARHRDATKLDAFRLAAVARRLAAGIRKHSNYRTFTRAELIDLLADAVRSGRVGLSNLPVEMRQMVADRNTTGDGT